jgi:hypothetical protein
MKGMKYHTRKNYYYEKAREREGERGGGERGERVLCLFREK